MLEMEEYQGISTNKTLHLGERQQQQRTTTTSGIEASVCDFVVAKLAYYSRVFDGRRQHNRIEQSPIAHVHPFVLSSLACTQHTHTYTLTRSRRETTAGSLFMCASNP